MQKIVLPLLFCLSLAGCATPGAERHRVSHILTRTEEGAQQALQRIQQGATFEEVARALSVDPGSARRRLAPGQISATPVHTVFGWHIVKVNAECEG